MNEKVKTVTVIFLLSFTCFLTQCKGCLDVDNETNRIVPGQVAYTVSCGFPAPYFDVEILTAADESYYYRVKGSDMTGVSVPVNFIVIIGLCVLIIFLASKELIALSRLLKVMLLLILLFSSALLLPFFPEILQEIALYIYIYPVLVINNLLEFLKLEAFEQNLSPRVYFVLLIVCFYYLVSLKNVIFKKSGG